MESSSEKRTIIDRSHGWIGLIMNFLALDFENRQLLSGQRLCSAWCVSKITKSSTGHPFWSGCHKWVFCLHTHSRYYLGDVEDQPTFDQCWKSIKPFFEGIDFAVAHNAGFDKGVLRACCRRYAITPPDLDFQCTMKLSRRYSTPIPPTARRLQKFQYWLTASRRLVRYAACAKNMIEIIRKTNT